MAAFALIAAVGISWYASSDFRSFVYFALWEAHFAMHPAPAFCKQRAAEHAARVELKQRQAKDALKIGTRKDEVERFFASEKIPLYFDYIGQYREAIGELNFKGLADCANVACGDDSMLIGVRVRVDADGTVVADPLVMGMYTNCL